ncbi:MAG: integral rane sensor signal transduction histidine kinase [Ferruginibacter sp.]|nr:integral rane sensor signal transduction histidine kinase [Ferruginibacter sp.]
MSKTLAQKNNRYLLTWLPIVLLLGSVLFFVMLDHHSSHMQEKQLSLKQQNIWKAFLQNPESLPGKIDGEYRITKNDEQSLDTASGYAHLTKQYSLYGNNYQLTTYIPTKEYSHLVIKVFATELFVFILLLIAIVFLNKKSSLKLWQPFYKTLESTRVYDVVNEPFIQLNNETGITEFNQLNNELNSLTDKVNLAYTNQKQFVENASHEIQTPLAIIRSKLDLLINEPGLKETTAGLLADITEANDRLSQMNKSLLILAKIDNNQFPEKTDIDVSALIGKLLATYKDHYDNFPKLSEYIETGVHLIANPALIEILFSNLIKNAVIHNISGGFINLQLTASQLIIENSGLPLTMDPSLLFERFNKGNADSKTTGLGLSLVKQICRLYYMDLEYTFANQMHTIKVNFKQA